MGSSSNSGQRAAEQAERERQAQISATQARVNQIFDSPERAAQRAEFGTALRDLFNQDLQRQKGVADRDLRFALARSGQIGGSRQIDAGRTMGEEYQRGVLEAERRAQGGVADLMSRDEQSRLQLAGLAQSGTNVTAAAQQAAGALRANLESASADARAGGLGDLFGSVAEYKRASDTAAEKRRADKDYLWQQQKYSPMFGGGGY